MRNGLQTVSGALFVLIHFKYDILYHYHSKKSIWQQVKSLSIG